MDRGVALTVITDKPLSLDECVSAVESAQAGAVVTFAGIVRDHDGGRAVRELAYEAHPSAETTLAEVADAISAKCPAVTIAVGHRTGSLGIGDLALACAVASAHRSDAFAACAELVDLIKLRVPIWKNQVFTDGTSEWVGSLG